MKAAEWIDKLKAQRGLTSDYKAAQALGVSRNTISNYRGGARQTFDDAMALKVAAMLDEQPEILLLDQAIERAKNEEAKTVLTRVLQRLGGVAACALIATVSIAPNPVQASALDRSVYYVKLNRWHSDHRLKGCSGVLVFFKIHLK